MFSFLGSIFGKIISAVASVFVAVGLISSPASVTPQPLEPVVIEIATPTPASEEIEEAIDIKAELDALKKQLADEQKKRKDLEKKVVAPAPTPKPTPVVITPPLVPVITAPAPSAPITPAPAMPLLLPGQFLLPSGAVVDSMGNVVKAAPPTPIVSTQTVTTTATTTPVTPPPAPVWPPADGSTVDIQQSLISNMNFNSHLTCDQLWSIPPSKKDLCRLYKDYPGTSKYIWNIIDDISR